MSKNINIQLNVSESEQMSSHQNASLHGGPNNTAISIDTEVQWPVSVQTEEDMKHYLEVVLKNLAEQGWKFNITIGKDVDTENSEEGQ
jgi:hypothetical protein